MIGDNMGGPGGIAAVVRTYAATGLFEQQQLEYLSNYDGPGLWRQATVMLRTIRRLVWLRLLGQLQLAHIHSSARGSFWRAAMLATLCRTIGVAYIIHIHSGEFVCFHDQECGALGRALIRKTLATAQRVICLTPMWSQKIQNIALGARCLALPNPVTIPTHVASQPPNGQIELLFLGRLIEIKGIYDLLRAMPLVLARHPNIVLRVGGDGELAKAKKLADDLGIAKSVKFEGWLGDTEKSIRIARSTIVVVPSHFEAFGMVILEAMAHGKVTLATNVGGIPEVMIDRLHGRLITPRDSLALANALTELLDHSTALGGMGLAARSHCTENFAAPTVTRLLGQLYGQLLGSMR